MSAEKAIVVEEKEDGTVLVQRQDGSIWVLDPKVGWCNWAWKYEGKEVDLEFGNRESRLTNDKGESCDFWTEKPL